MLVPARSGIRHADLRFCTFVRVISASGLKFWPSYVRPHCNQSEAGGLSSMPLVTVLNFAKRAELPGDALTGASRSSGAFSWRGIVSAASASVVVGKAVPDDST